MNARHPIVITEAPYTGWWGFYGKSIKDDIFDYSAVYLFDWEGSVSRKEIADYKIAPISDNRKAAAEMTEDLYYANEWLGLYDMYSVS